MNNWNLVMAVAAVTFVSHWVGDTWFDGPAPNPPVNYSALLADQKKLRQQLDQIDGQLDRMEEFQFAKVATVDPNTNALTVDGALLKSTLTTVMKEELKRISPMLAEQVEAMQTLPVMAGEKEEISEQEAFNQSTDIIWEAIALGEWQADHTARMLPLVDALTSEQRVELLEQFHSAVGRGEIDLSSHMPPL